MQLIEIVFHFIFYIGLLYFIRFILYESFIQIVFRTVMIDWQIIDLLLRVIARLVIISLFLVRVVEFLISIVLI